MLFGFYGECIVPARAPTLEGAVPENPHEPQIIADSGKNA